VLAALPICTLVLIWSLGPIPQDPSYHAFADDRPMLGIPNFLDVVSSLAFAVVGGLGVRFCLRRAPGAVGLAWLVTFAGTALVAVGSGYYHWAPDSASLVWDRAAMTVAFMGLFVALIGEYAAPRLVPALLLPCLLLGLASVAYWHRVDDLRLYAWVQLTPLLSIPFLMALFRNGFTHEWLLPSALGCYVLAKIAEAGDSAIYLATGAVISGHTLKHLFAAAGLALVLRMLAVRQRTGRRGPRTGSRSG
jgi:hypothetical protein